MQGLSDYLYRERLTQAQFAARIGVRQPTVCNWINGKGSPRLAMLIKISEATGMTLDELTAQKQPESVLEA